MMHYGKLGDMPIEIELSCKHPEGIENGCPTRDGDCAECGYCVATLTAKQALALVRAAGVE